MKAFSSEFGEKVESRSPFARAPQPSFSTRLLCLAQRPLGFRYYKISAKSRHTYPNKSSFLLPLKPRSVVSISTSIKDDFLHYRKNFDVPAVYVGHDAILHLDAVDQVCDVFFNGLFVGHHESGYSPIAIHVSYLQKRRM
jgi:hypothetical protein